MTVLLHSQAFAACDDFLQEMAPLEPTSGAPSGRIVHHAPQTSTSVSPGPTPFVFQRRGSGPLQAMEGGGDVSGQILHSVCAPFVRSPNGGRYALRIFPMRDLIRTCVSLWNSRGAVVNSC